MKICIPFEAAEAGGPSSFVRKLSAGLAERGHQVVYDLADQPYDRVLIVNATRQIWPLWQAKRRGIPIVQRLGGLNWMHRYVPTAPRAWGMQELRNLLMRLIRRYLADRIVYQSEFVQDWWQRRAFAVPKPASIIYNGVDLAVFNPAGPQYETDAEICFISVEGTQGNDPHLLSVDLAQRLLDLGLRVELLMFGAPQGDLTRRLAAYPFVKFMGVIPNADLPYYYRAATFYLLTDVIAACPNSVIEALACGTPVLGYRAGAYPEMIDESVGRSVPPAGDPWKAENPGNEAELVQAAQAILAAGPAMRQNARTLAEQKYGLDAMVEHYLTVFKA